MIISKDLFIFGEQIFATIIPEGGSSQGSQQQQQQQQQQQPAIINTTATVGTAAAAVAATLQTLQIPTAATVATAAAITTSTTTAARAAEQVAVVVVVEQTNKLQKIPKEVEEQQQPKNKKKEKPQLQQQLKKITDEINIGIKTKIIKEEQTPTTTTTTRKQILVAVEDVEEEDDDDNDEEQETADEAAEKEPLVRRNLAKIVAAAGTPTTTTPALIPTAITAKATAAVAAGKQTTKTLKNFALRAEETLPPQQQQHQQHQQEQEPKQQQPQTDCRLQLEPEVLLSLSSSTSSCCSSTLAASPTNTATATAKITTSSSTIVVTDRRSDDVDQVANIINSEDSSQLNMGKVTLGNNTRSDHAMVTLPFISEQHRTLQLTFQNINVLHNERKILSDVSGLVSPGEVLAIMGPSGSGKTTLLDCLSGQRRIDSGSIYLNREPLSKKWRRKICYVLQEEVFFSGLTLRETVMYTALLRLPEKMPKEEKKKLVDRILEALELNFCQQTKFGDYLNRGLSGGEKKRANIACELLTNPLLMLLDEPTSGLDSHSAISLMKVLKRYALQEQKTVVITVHQPSSQMFHMFDKLLLLYNGRTAYFGEVKNIYRYFEDIGVAIKPHYNPADFVLEQLKSYPDIREKLFVAAKESHGNFLNRNCITVNHHHNQLHHNNCHHSTQQNGGITVTSTNGTNVTPNDNTIVVNTTPIVNDKTDKHHDTLINDILNNYYKDIHNNHVNHDAMLILGNHHTTCEEAEAAQQLWCGADSQSNFSSASSSDYQQYESSDDWLDYPTHFHTQFRVLSSRNFKEAKPRMLSKLNWFQTVGLALMAGAIWFQIPRTEEFLHDLQGWMFFSQTYWMLFALFGALNSFPSEREVISKERRSGAYRLSAYYLAKMFGELPLVITLPTVYLMISYPMLGCTSFKLFFLMLVFLLLNTIVAQSVGFFIGACCMDMNVSITLSALYTLATQLFGGYLSSRIPDGLSWIRYTSMIHYAYQNMQILEFREGPAIRCGSPSSYEICKDNTTTIGGTTTTTSNTFIPYEEILKAQNSNSPLWLNTLILMMFFLVFRGLGYAVLRYVRCPKT